MTAVLVTGATGFVGSELCARLSVMDYKVRGAVRHGRTILPGNVEAAAISNVGPNTDWAEALVNVESVIHLAARVHVMHESAVDPDAEFRRVNLDGSLRLARSAATAGVKRFLYVSSIKVNGEATFGQPFTASDPPAPEDAYGRSKLAAEQALFEVAQRTGMELVVVRPPLIYGPGVKGNMLRLLGWVAKGYPLPFGAVHNRRSLVALDNFVDLLVRCLDHPAAAGRVFLAADGTDLSTSDLIRALAQGMGRRARLLPVPPALLQAVAGLAGRGADVRRLLGSLQVDASETRELLGWQPPVPVEKAMSDMARWYLQSRL